MFDFDKIVKRLGKFDELPAKKQKKTLEAIFCSKEFKEWFYQVGEDSKEQPMTKPMVTKLFNSLSSPTAIKRVKKFIEESDHENFDRSSITIAFLVVEQAIENINKANNEISEGHKNGDLSGKDVKEYKEKADKYNELVGELLGSIRTHAKPSVKDICKKSNLPRSLVYTTYFMVPDREYIPKFKIGMYMNQLLQEIYKYTGKSGIEDVGNIKWGPYFGSFFGNELTSSAAISILLEGTKRIDPYREMEYFDDVRKVWDSLTRFALTELDRAPDNVRRQMLELYIKRIDRIFKNGHGPRLRVDLLTNDFPVDLSNLEKTISQYAEKIAKITGQVNKFRKTEEKTSERAENRENNYNSLREELLNMKFEEGDLPPISFNDDFEDDDDDDDEEDDD